MPMSVLPVHPVTRRSALGWRKPRPGEDDQLHPIWPVLGAAEDDDQEDQDDTDGSDETADDGDGDTADDSDPDGADQLGDKGKRALASMKGKWRAERDRARELAGKLAEKDGADEAEQVRRQAETAALSKANQRIVRAEVKAAAKGVLADPADAYKFLDLDQFEVDESGDLDSDEVAEAIEELIKSKPYLAAAPARRFQGTGDGGAARKAGRPKQLTRTDLKSMSPEAIDKAREDGRLDDLMGGK